MSRKPPTVECPDCGTRYRWQAQFAAKQLHCRCGCTFTPQPPAEAPMPAPPPLRAPTSPFTAGTSPVQQALEAGAFEAGSSPFMEKILPALLLGVGSLLGAGVVGLVTDGTMLWLACVGGLIAFEAVVGIPLMIGSLMWMAATFGEAFGGLRQALFKAASITLGTGLIADAVFAYFMTSVHVLAGDWPTLYVGAFGGGFAIYFLLQGLAAWLMFQSSPAVVAGVVACNYLPRFALFFAAFYALEPIWP